MKKYSILILLFLGFSSIAEAQAINNVPKPQKMEDTSEASSKKPAKFKFLKGEVYDFGNIPEGPVAEHVFEFKNVGKQPLIITNTSASCGCTMPEWPKEPILPGKKGKITIRYNTEGRGNQPFDKQVFITSNVPTENNKPYELRIKGFVTPKPSIPQDVKTR